VVAPAVALAEAGVGLSAQVAPIAKILTPILTLTPDTAGLFAPHGAVLAPGEVFRSPDLAKLLRRVAAGEGEALRQALLKNFGAPTGRLTPADLEKSHVHTHAPVTVQLGDYTVALNAPPSLGGLLVGFGLEMLKDVPASVWRDETETFVTLLACMAVSQGARSTLIDPAAQRGSDALGAIAADFMGDANLARWREPMARAVKDGPRKQGYALRDLGSTTHVSCIDRDGLACCITSSNGEGCGHLVPFAGVMANNFLGEEDINPGGFHLRPAGERMTSMMCPTLVLKDGRPTLALGTGGSNRIRTALLQVLVHHLLRGLPLETAVKMPRLHYEGGPLFVEREVLGVRLSQATLDALAKRVETVVYFDAPNMFFGGVHVAAPHGVGVGDARRGGAVGGA
jgi:gamma-glutamyltranspeptidase/glutathione hydrolase